MAKKMQASTAAAPATQTIGEIGTVIPFDPSAFGIVKDLTCEFRWTEGKAEYLKLLTKMTISTRKQRAKEGEAKREPPLVIRAFNYATGKEVEVIAAKVLSSVLDETYPNGGYVGKSFAITQMPKAEGKNYRKYSVIEIAPPKGE